MAIKGYTAFPKAPALQEPHHQIVHCHVQDTRWGRGSYPSVEKQSVYSPAPVYFTEFSVFFFLFLCFLFYGKTILVALIELFNTLLGSGDLYLSQGYLSKSERNSPVHNYILVTDYLTKMGIKTVLQPPYSRDFAPCDFWLFPKLRGCRYATFEEMKEA